ncbi:MAG TPA: hypothetical protein VMZ00_14890 [Sporichthya sp.]|nr:hypothetical protein [Sporichthya sp.]
MKRWALAMVLTSLLALGGCGSGSDSNRGTDAQDSRPGAAAPGGTIDPKNLPDPHYAVFPSKVPGPGWELTEAVRQLGTGAAPLGGLPGVDWYAEFKRPDTGTQTNVYLSLTGYIQSLDARKAELASPTAQVTDGEINGHKAFWSVDPGDLENGMVVTWEVTRDYTLEVFATGVSLDDLLAAARTVKDASEAEWIAAGGHLGDCGGSRQTACPGSAQG